MTATSKTGILLASEASPTSPSGTNGPVLNKTLALSLSFLGARGPDHSAAPATRAFRSVPLHLRVRRLFGEPPRV